jgi:hypothetical protein
MNLDLLTARRVLKAVREGLPVDEALLLIESLLDGFDDAEDWDRLEYLLKAALQGDRKWLDAMILDLKGRPSQREKESLHGQ